MDYTNMSSYYDVIMTSGYYDYQGIVDSLIKHKPFDSVLEIGCGTGLILEELAKRDPQTNIMGVDLTQSMLDIAHDRLLAYPTISLSEQNVVHFDLKKQFDLAFSYGGVWYFVIDGDKEPFMVSHIPEDAPNEEGLRQLSRHVQSGGQLLLGIQGPHHDYERPISNGMIYSQKILPRERGFIKHYYLYDGPTKMMEQTVIYRTYSFDESLKMLSENGFEYVPSIDASKKFLSFKKH
jgi:SAM-dependent methyltransferase